MNYNKVDGAGNGYIQPAVPMTLPHHSSGGHSHQMVASAPLKTTGDSQSPPLETAVLTPIQIELLQGQIRQFKALSKRFGDSNIPKKLSDSLHASKVTPQTLNSTVAAANSKQGNH